MRGRHKRSSTCPTKSQLTRIDSVHHLEVDPLSEMLLTVENPEPVLETFQNHLAAGTLEVLSPVFSGRKNSITNDANDKCVECGAVFSSDPLEKHNDKIHHKHRNLSISEGGQEDKLIKAKILTTDASPLLFKDFLDALDLINTNKDFLLKYINDPGSPLPFELHTQPHSPNGKSRRAKSISLPVSGSSSATKDSEHIVDEWFNTKGQIESEIPNLADFHRPSTSSSHKPDHHQLLGPDQESVERDHNNETPSVSNNVKNKNFKDLRKKIKHIIEESKNEKLRITMDAVVDKIPRGNKFSKNVRKLMNHEKFKQHNNRQLSGMRTSSLKESVNRYSQLYDTCFHNEVVSNKEEKPPKTETLKLKTEEKSSVLKTPKSFKRFLSLPNLKSYFNQNEELSVLLSPQNSVRKSEDRIRSSSTLDGYSNYHIFSPSPSDHTNQESIMKDERRHVIVKSASDSGSDVNDEVKSEKSIRFDGLGNMRDSEFCGSNEHDIGYTTESSTMLVEANSAFSSDTSFLDYTFELENLNILEGIYIDTLTFLYFNFNIMIKFQCLCEFIMYRIRSRVKANASW